MKLILCIVAFCIVILIGAVFMAWMEGGAKS